MRTRNGGKGKRRQLENSQTRNASHRAPLHRTQREHLKKKKREKRRRAHFVRGRQLERRMPREEERGRMTAAGDFC